MAGPARAGLRGGRSGGGAGTRGRRAHSRPRLPQPYGDDPHGGAAVEGGPGIAPRPAACSKRPRPGCGACRVDPWPPPGWGRRARPGANQSSSEAASRPAVPRTWSPRRGPRPPAPRRWLKACVTGAGCLGGQRYPLWSLVLTVYSAEPAVRAAGRRKTGGSRLARTCGGKQSGGAPGRPLTHQRGCNGPQRAPRAHPRRQGMAGPATERGAQKPPSAKAQASQRPLRSQSVLHDPPAHEPGLGECGNPRYWGLTPELDLDPLTPVRPCPASGSRV
ncbi:unnamed protein product [Rangifer tarandus platyrhynchus]|uniref:Uncharacterized protein n=2 Tax=Rangifer tarandus platyrhynchus TaxID=3082113 RepID=A0ABN8YVT7_RANTA|nr:unnamed protein product [Rangifer tarandus platyrhynchus]CAI9693633.1 unnamed protein product [Rangifer tarandus platyrhynchus]